jgi:hypothetical protein
MDGEPVELDEHRGMAAQKPHWLRWSGSHRPLASLAIQAANPREIEPASVRQGERVPATAAPVAEL